MKNLTSECTEYAILLLFSEFVEKMLNPQIGIKLISKHSFPGNKFSYIIHLYNFKDLRYNEWEIES